MSINSLLRNAIAHKVLVPLEGIQLKGFEYRSICIQYQLFQYLTPCNPVACCQSIKGAVGLARYPTVNSPLSVTIIAACPVF
jgi:hypothetical protein